MLGMYSFTPQMLYQAAHREIIDTASRIYIAYFLQYIATIREAAAFAHAPNSGPNIGPK